MLRFSFLFIIIGTIISKFSSWATKITQSWHSCCKIENYGQLKTQDEDSSLASYGNEKQIEGVLVTLGGFRMIRSNDTEKWSTNRSWTRNWWKLKLIMHTRMKFMICVGKRRFLLNEMIHWRSSAKHWELN